MIEAVNLTKRFDDIVAVDHISATIKDGSVFGLIGTNGAGKSTFLRLASGVLKPDEGCITIDGHEVFENTPAKSVFSISRMNSIFSTTQRHWKSCIITGMYTKDSTRSGSTSL